MNWQPIETAPKDGSWVLVFGNPDDEERQTKSVVVAQYTNYLNGRTIDWHWQFAWFDGGYFGMMEDVTHWMPLPERPKA